MPLPLLQQSPGGWWYNGAVPFIVPQLKRAPRSLARYTRLIGHGLVIGPSAEPAASSSTASTSYLYRCPTIHPRKATRWQKLAAPTTDVSIIFDLARYCLPYQLAVVVVVDVEPTYHSAIVYLTDTLTHRIMITPAFDNLTSGALCTRTKESFSSVLRTRVVEGWYNGSYWKVKISFGRIEKGKNI